MDQNGYHYIINERGNVFEDKITIDINQLLYWVFENITSQMAFHFELQNRIKGKDPRRTAFSKQLELLGILNEEWKKEQERKHNEILSKHPFDDYASTRTAFYK